jgi:hypothetical protein
VGETGPIETRDQFKDDAAGQQARWVVELKAAQDFVKPWHQQADEAVKRYLGEHRPQGKTGLNLFHADVNTVRSLLYAKVPQVDVSRRFNDPDDDLGRVAAEMQERLLNTDIDRDDDGFKAVLRYALEDWTLAGLGIARVRYEVETETEPETPAIMRPDPVTGEEIEAAPAVPAQEVKSDEDAETDYFYWRKFLWSPCRSWNLCRWVAFATDMTRDELVKRFGSEIGKAVPIKKAESGKNGEEFPTQIKDAWSKAEIWEVWSKEDRKVYWIALGMDRVLDVKEDPLGLEGFFPCPKPLTSNETTTKFLPKPDYDLAKAQYAEIEEMDLRLMALVRMARVRGAYDKSRAPELGRILDSAEGDMVAVERWAALTERGGLKSALEFVPLGDIVAAIEALSAKRAEAIALIRQVTGLSDIMRGQASSSATATEQSIKAQFASTRVQTLQDELARFASDLQALRKEIVAKHFEPQTIIDRSNVMRTQDAPLAGQAVQLIKDRHADYRVIVRPENLAMQDMATQRQERAEALGALGQHFQSMMPLVQLAGAAPGALQSVLAFVIRTGQWMVSGLRGANEVEAAFDAFADAANKLASQPPQPPPPDPKVEAEKVKAGAEQFKAKAEMAQTQMDLEASKVEHAQRMREMAMKYQSQRMAVPGAGQPPVQPGGVA